MRFVSTRGGAEPASLKTALLDGLAPDGGLYVPEALDRWSQDELNELSRLKLPEIAARVLQPFVAGDLDAAALASVARDALTFPIPLVEVEPGVHALELFHGPTLAFKDVGARVMARLMAALHDGPAPTTVLVATSGDTGGAVAHAFHGVAHTRVVILYPDRRVSPTQEAQMTRFNGAESNVKAYAVAGSFDDCQRLVKTAFGDANLRHRGRLTSANSINLGRLLPQMVYYFHMMAMLSARGVGAGPGGGLLMSPPVVSVPSGNFGNLTAGLMAKRLGVPIARFVAATTVNDTVPIYLQTGRYEPRRSTPTLANAMDVGDPSNFDRMLWLYGGRADAMGRDVVGSRHDDESIRTTIRKVFERRRYLLDPHSAIAYMGLHAAMGSEGRKAGAFGPLPGRLEPPGVFLATAHPAKFAEIVEPIIGQTIDKPAPLADALSRPRPVLRVNGTLDALKGILGE